MKSRHYFRKCRETIHDRYGVTQLRNHYLQGSNVTVSSNNTPELRAPKVQISKLMKFPDMHMRMEPGAEVYRFRLQNTFSCACRVVRESGIERFCVTVQCRRFLNLQYSCVVRESQNRKLQQSAPQVDVIVLCLPTHVAYPAKALNSPSSSSLQR